MEFNTFQQSIIESPKHSRLFVSGPMGAGKTTAAYERLAEIRGVLNIFPGTILVLTPQRTMSDPYIRLADYKYQLNSSRIELNTMSGLVRRLVKLFWPLLSGKTLFNNPYQAPLFLTAESAQYHMGKIVEPMFNRGCFASIHLAPNRLYSQLLDNLNKSALVGFSYTEVGARLSNSWCGPESQFRVFQDSQAAINSFRDFCYQNNVLDFSLQVELFKQQLWPDPVIRKYLNRMYPYLVYDNAEEDPPYVHDLIKDWLPDLQGALVMTDNNGSFQQFLAADFLSANSIRTACESFIETQETIHSTPARRLILSGLTKNGISLVKEKITSADMESLFVLPTEQFRTFPELLNSVASWINQLIQQQVPPSEIAILSPYVSPSLKLALQQRLSEYSISLEILHSSTPIIDEPFTKVLVNLLTLAQKDNSQTMNKNDLALTFKQSVQGLDLIRARLISNQVSFNSVNYLIIKNDQSLQERVPDHLIKKCEVLLNWLNSSEPDKSFSVVLTRLFDEVLSTTGFVAETDPSKGRLVSRLIESYNKFIASFPYAEQTDSAFLNSEFLTALKSGLISAQYSEDPEPGLSESKVLIAPAMTFLTRHRIVDYQVWLSIGSDGWYRRLEQPLTNPYVLNRNWPPAKKWDSDEETKASETLIKKVTNGLTERCRKQVFLGYSKFGESGVEEQGLLLRRLQYLYRLARIGSDNHG